MTCHGQFQGPGLLSVCAGAVERTAPIQSRIRGAGRTGLLHGIALVRHAGAAVSYTHLLFYIGDIPNLWNGERNRKWKYS